MSAVSFTAADTDAATYWPSSTIGGATVGGALRHWIDLNHFFGDALRHWPDALVSEARRHLAECSATIETALILLARDSEVGRFLSAMERPIIWPAIQHYPHILTPDLMRHMRLRAAVGLLSRQSLRVDGDPAADVAPGTGSLIHDPDPDIADAAAALTLAEGRWSANGAPAMPMQADLPAEHFAELVWTGAAVLGTALHRAGMAERSGAMTTMTDAAFAFLARHDEGAGPFAQATRLARMLRDRDRHAEFLGLALGERRYLLFAALAAEVTHIEMETVLDVLVHGQDAQLSALCKALGGAASDYRHLLIDLRIVRGERDDPALVRLSQSYDDLRDEDVIAQTDMLRCPTPLRAKLALIPTVDAA